MLSIRVNDIFLDLDDTQVRYEIINSIFEQDALQSDWSFPFKIKWTDKNGKALGFANMLEVPNKKVSYRAFIYFETKYFITGNLILNGGGNNYFNCNIAGGMKALINAGTKLKDLPYYNPGTGDGIVVLSSITNAALDYQTADYKNIIAFPPHSNPNFYGNANPDFQGIVNIVIAEDGTMPLNTPAIGGNQYCVVPFIYLFFILETAFKESGLTPAGTFWIDTEMSKTLLYNNYSLDDNSEHGCLVKLAANQILDFDHTPGVYNYAALVDTVAGCYSHWENLWTNVGHWFVLPEDSHYSVTFTCRIWGYDSYTNTPGTGTIQINIAGLYGSVDTIMASQIVVVALNATMDVTLTVDIPSSVGLNSIYIWCNNGDLTSNCNVTMLSGAQMVVTKIDDQIWNTMTRTVAIKNHVPDMTVEELLNEMKKWLQLDFTYDLYNNKVIVDYIETILNEPPVLDLSSKLSKDYEMVFDDTNKGYVVGYDFGSGDNLIENNFKTYDKSKLLGFYTSVDTLPAPATVNDLAIVKSTNKVMVVSAALTWVEFTDNYFDITTGLGTTDAKTKLAPMMMYSGDVQSTDPTHTRALMPAISEPGSSIMYDLGINAASLRVVFMRGLNTPGAMYVYTSATNYDQLGASKGNYTMKMNDVDGLYLKFHEKIITALTSAYIVMRDLLADINLLSNPKLKRKVSAGNMHWLLKSVSASIGRTIQTSKSYWLKL